MNHAFAFAIAAVEDAAIIRPLWISLKYGEDLAENSPLWHLRQFLVSDDAKLLNRGSDRGVAELVLHALHLHIAGDTIDRLEPSLVGLHAFRALQPERVERIAAIFKLP